jgi:8-oxo-dGTP diphosphatase
MTDWTTWEPTMRATLLFVVQNDRVLLIRKKRGLGAGKINGPGGRLDPGESYTECAVREVREELGISVHDPVQRGELHFQFVDGLALYCVVFVATSFSGVPVETDEAIPAWTPLDPCPTRKCGRTTATGSARCWPVVHSRPGSTFKRTPCSPIRSSGSIPQPSIASIHEHGRALRPLQGRIHQETLSRGIGRFTPPAPGYALVALQATLVIPRPPTPATNSRLYGPRESARVVVLLSMTAGRHLGLVECVF